MEKNGHNPPLHPFHAGLWPLTLGGLTAGLFLVLLATSAWTLVEAARSALVNAAVLAGLGALVRLMIIRVLPGLSARAQAALHVLAALVFTFLWYWLLMIAGGIAQARSFTNFHVLSYFPQGALVWQLYQGLILYCLVALVCYVERWRAILPSTKIEPGDHTAKPESPSRYFIRQGEDIHPLEVSSIVSISGAGDYTEVITLNGSHLTSMTMAEFETALESDRFLRVHRSQIVNIDRIERAEPAGAGRILLHMEIGPTIKTSKTGARLFRERII